MTDSHRGLPFPRRIYAVIAMSLGAVAINIDGSIPSVVLPTIAKTLHVSDASTVFIVTIYQLILSMALLPLAALGDRIGYRRLYQMGFLLYCSAAVLSFFANDLFTLVAVRSLQALGSAAAISVSVALVRGIYPTELLGSGLGINTIFNASGTALAPMLGGLILSFANWHWVFVAVIPIILISLMLSPAMPEPAPSKHSFDLLGASLCALTFGPIIGGLQGAIQSNHLLPSIAVIVFGLVVAWFFIRHENNEKQPVLPVDLLQSRVIAQSIISCFCAVLGSITLLIYMPFRLQHGFGFHPGEIGGMMVAYAIASVFVAPTSGILSDRIPVALLGTIGMTVASLGLLSIAFMPEHPTYFSVAWRLLLCGGGFGMFSSPNARLIVASAPPSRSAAAGSLFTTTRMLSQAIGATLVAALLSFGLGEGSVPAFVAMCLALIAGLISFSSLLTAKRAKNIEK